MRSKSKNLHAAKSADVAPAEAPGVSKTPFPLAGIGASAGGLEAFTKLLHLLPPGTGEAGLDLLKMAHDSLSLELAASLQEAKKPGAVLRRTGRFDGHDAIRKINLEALSVKLPGSQETCFMVLFKEIEKGRENGAPPARKKPSAPAPVHVQGQEFRQLHGELAAAGECLRAAIEQQQTAREELKCAQEKFLDYVTAMVDTVRAPLLVLDADLRVATANDAFCRLFRLPKSDTENKLLYELGNGQWDLPELRRLLAEITTGNSVLKDFEVIRDFPKIGRRTLRLDARRLGQKNSAAPLIFLSLEDITEWKQIEETNRWLAAIVESTDDAVIGEDLNGRIISCNRGATQLYGYAPEEMIGKSILMFGTPALKDEQAKIIETIRQGGSVDHYETIRLRKDGSPVDVSLTVSPVRDISGKIIGISKIARSITERKRAELSLRESLQRETAARQSAEMASHAKDEFLATLSHELRTPLNPVLLIASDAVNDKDLPVQVRANFDTIRKNIELEARIIDDLLDITRITCGKLGLEKHQLDAHAILREVITGMKMDFDNKKHHLKVSLTAKQHAILGDAVRLQQVFGNLLKNAVKFTPVNGKITVNTFVSVDTGNFCVKMTDTGIGMTGVELDRVFAAFSQGDHASRAPHRFGGLGLGLAISRKLVELHGGRIHAESDGPDQGSTFTVELPLTNKEKADELPGEDASPGPPAPAGGKTTQRRILVVEDHEPTRNALARLLLHRRYTVLAAGSIAEARAIAAGREKMDFVISDIGLPDGSGNDLMQELSEKYGLSGVALTGYGMEQDVQRSLAAGFVAHLTKPVRIQALEQVLANLTLV